LNFVILSINTFAATGDTFHLNFVILSTNTFATTYSHATTLVYSSIPGNRNWQIETADWNLDVRLDI